MRDAGRALLPAPTRRWSTPERRSCCSTAAGGRTPSPAAPVGGRGDAVVRRHARHAPLRGPPGRHHCGHREPVPARCDACGSVSIARHGTGTERLEPGSTGRSSGWTPRSARRPGCSPPSRQPPRGVLVGTQMVAKGHDFATSTSASWSTPTPRCASPTSAPRSGRSRSSPSWRAALAAGPRAAACSCRRSRLRRAEHPLRRAPRRRRLPHRRARASPRAALPAVLDPDPDRLLLGGARRRACRRRRHPPRAPRRRGARPRAAVSPARARAPRWWSRPRTVDVARWRASDTAVEAVDRRSCAQRRPRSALLAADGGKDVDGDPQ